MVCYDCPRCGYITNKKSNIKNHINRKIICKPLLCDTTIEIAKIFLKNSSNICKKCNKEFSRTDSCKRHELKCNVKENLEIDDKLTKELKKKDNQITEVNNELKNKDEKIERLTNKIENMKVLANVPKNRIRSQARKKYMSSNLPLKCLNCNFDQHIHVDHIKQIQDFGNGDKIIDINDITNLCALCPNCHYGKDTLKDPKILRKVFIHSVLVNKILRTG